MEYRGVLTVLIGLSTNSSCLSRDGRGFILCRACCPDAVFGFCLAGRLGGFLFRGLGRCGRGMLAVSLLSIILFIIRLLSKMGVTLSLVRTVMHPKCKNRLQKNVLP